MSLSRTYIEKEIIKALRINSKVYWDTDPELDPNKEFKELIKFVKKLFTLSKHKLFLTYIKSYIQKLETLDFNYINNQENDDWYSLTAKPYSDMMDFLPTNQVCKIDYRKLFFEHDDATIKQMMQLYNSNQDILYYKTQIQLYHERNIKLFNQLKTELPLAVEKI